MANPKITIIDYGVGNLQSLKKAFNFCGIEADVSEDAETILKSDAVILPGVGSYEAGMRGLKVRGLVGAVKNFAYKNKPMLGICLGAQLMLSEGYEFGIFNGLDIMPGNVERFSGLTDNEKIPQIGWNGVYASTVGSWQNSVLADLPENFNAYFVHSYILAPDSSENILGLTSYGGHEFCSIMKKGNIYASQFHPEKSGEVGLKIIKNFIDSI